MGNETELGKLQVLLVEDDEDDYVILRDVLSRIPLWKFQLEWVSSYEEALRRVQSTGYDICFVDYRLGERNGIELMDEIRQKGFTAPIILLTGRGSIDVDLEAMQRGVADYLEKGFLHPELVERSIRYAIERTKTMEKLRKSENELRTLSTKLLSAQEKERRHVAQELHDSIGASLTGIKFALEQKLANMERKNGMTGGISLEQIISLVRGTIEEIQRISSNLRSAALDDMGILATIRTVCREFEEIRAGVQVKSRIKVREEDVPEPLKVVIYRVLQEAMNNVMKHSDATNVRLCLERIDGKLEFTIEDNGKGFDAAEVMADGNLSSGLGLAGMKERTELSNGSFEIVSRNGGGTVIQASWPLMP
jgi:signal transduction histidine kinase